VILRALGRLILVPLGLLLGVLAAGAVLVTLGLEWTTHTLSGHADVPGRIAVLIDMGLGVVTLAAAASVVPALLLVVVGEVARIRSALFYVLGGGVALVVLPLLSRMTTLTDGGSVPTRVWTVLATAGFAGGLVYWAIAGRRA